jgi:uncharacterized OsmC-like protein
MAAQLEVRATWQGGLTADVSARGHEVRIDEPADAGGQDTGMMPTELFCASLASCFCLAMAWAARKRGLEVPGLAVVVRAHRDGKKLRYGRIEVEAHAELERPELAELVRRARPLCWVSNTLAETVHVEYGPA